jgi:hypothetical protein
MQQDRAHNSRSATSTWNDSLRIAKHRELSPAQRLRLTIEASRATLRFAQGTKRER